MAADAEISPPNEEPLAFEHLFVPLVLNARSELFRKLDQESSVFLSAGALLGWERYLLARFSHAGAKAALWQFQVFKSVRAAFPGEKTENRVTDPLYSEFVARPELRLEKLFHEFPLFLELSAALASNWVDTVVEFITHLRDDHAGFAARFAPVAFVLPVTTLKAGLSDPHRQGRCVVRIEAANGSSLYYKPRSIAPEARFAELVDRLNNEGIPNPLRAAKCWDVGGHGWMESVAAAPCEIAADVHAFYWRAGALLGLVHLGRGIDIHRENLIAANAYPVLIDLEALLHLPGSDDAQAYPQSVLRTGFLPVENSKTAPIYGWSALSREVDSRHLADSWFNLNKDEMEVTARWQSFRDRSHLPVLEGEVYLAPDYVPDIESGYRWVGERLLSETGAVELLDRWSTILLATPRRLIVRPTVHYQNSITELTSAESLRASSLETEITRRLRKIREGMYESEVSALSQLDVPYFEQPPQDASKRPWKTFPTTQEYEVQTAIIRKSLSPEPL